MGGGGTGQIKAEIFCYKSVPCLSVASEVIPSDPLGISGLRLCIRLPKAQGIYFIISQIPSWAGKTRLEKIMECEDLKSVPAHLLMSYNHSKLLSQGGHLL